MSSVDPGAASPRPADVEHWLAGLGLEPVERAERDRIASWDLVLDGRRRFDLRVTVILDPSLAVIAWAHYAPPIGDMFRKSYRKLLRWNDEYPFVKFSVSEDERPVLTVELPIGEASETTLGIGLARILGLADRLLEESAGWLWLGGRIPELGERVSRNEAFLARHEAALTELLGPVGPSENDA
jgi:Putative bacterial sensory transduction regulator